MYNYTIENEEIFPRRQQSTIYSLRYDIVRMQKSFGEKQECPTANTRACIASFITSTTKCSVIIPASLEITGELQAPHIAACTSILLGKNFKGGFTSEKKD